MSGGVRAWLPEAGLALAVLLLGATEVAGTAPGSVGGAKIALVLVVVSTAGTVTLCRHAPGVALALVWML